VTSIPQHCQARSATHSMGAGYCPNPAEWVVDVQISGTELILALALCKADLEAMFEAVPGALSPGLHTTVVGTPGGDGPLMFPATSCQTKLGIVPEHEHGDDDGWMLAEQVDDIGLGTGVYRTGDGSLHVVPTAAGIRLQQLAPTQSR